MNDRVQHRENYFESLRRNYQTASEADIILLDDGSLVMTHPNDLHITHTQAEKLTLSQIDSAKNSTNGLQKDLGATPLFKEYLTGAVDRGLEAMLDVKGSTTPKAIETARRTVQEIAELRDQGAFKGQEEGLKKIWLHSPSPEALEEIKKVREEKGLNFRTALAGLTDADLAANNPITKTVVDRIPQSVEWKSANIWLAKELGCDALWLPENTNITQEIVNEAHEKGLLIFIFVGTYDEKKINFLNSLGVDKVMY